MSGVGIPGIPDIPESPGTPGGEPIHVQAAIIGAGPAGLAAAVRLHDLGVSKIVVFERERVPGGILRQCIHDGFGLTRFRESLSGPEYAARFIREARERYIPILADTSVVELDSGRRVRTASRTGMAEYRADAVILAMGCRERSRGALAIPGQRPAGVCTAGVAQAYLNLHNRMPGREVVILGSGDIGLIMARRLTLEGARVLGVYEILPYPSGLPRNLAQCLDDFGIPLFLSHTVVDIHGSARLQGVTVARVDERRQPISGTERRIPCDTLVLSVGLIPENELSLMAGVELDDRTRGPVVDEGYQTTVPGIFAAGNVLQVHDLVDYVSLEAERLAESVACFLQACISTGQQAVASADAVRLDIRRGSGILYVVPRRVDPGRDIHLSLRVSSPMGACELRVTQNGRVVFSRRLAKAVPAELVQATLKAGILDARGDLEVVVAGRI